MLKKLGAAFAAIVVILGAVLIFGPREPVDETISIDKAAIATDPQAYLAAEEAAHSDIIEGAHKQIIWNDPANKAKTSLSVVYIHGFSATLEEIRPLPDQVAAALGANLFYTRLSGHGRTGDAMAEPTVNDWFNDTAEAIEVGRAIGERVVVISVSTGGTFVAWAATKPEMMENVAGLVFISPNFAINNPAAPLLSAGAARYLLPPIFGAERSFEAINPEHKKWWTTKYPTAAIFPMAESVRFVDKLDKWQAKTPAMFIYHPDDKVVSADATKRVAAFWGGPTVVEEVTEAEDPFNHVIAGRVLSPSNTAPLARKIIDWIKTK
ncbi:alpha/beta hydrolase [Pseudahrensia aquimaris]|uniref:Alpha/beta hydrolase n=1 Tax=Pseudahrensia aquimaris TaxID=744461 RepID=A0ABW3FN59_9HYPH